MTSNSLHVKAVLVVMLLKAVHISGSKKEIALQILSLYDWLLTYLKSNGFLLNVVKPELLLDIDDFQRLLQAKSSKVVTLEDEDLLEHWQKLANNFDWVSSQAWSVLIAQVLQIRSAIKFIFLLIALLCEHVCDFHAQTLFY